MNEKVAVIIVTFNRKNLLVECIEALLAQSRPIDKIIIIDNNSADGTPELVSEKGYLENEVIDYIRQPNNNGCSDGFHKGMAKAYQAGYNWFWVMDDDVKPKLNCLEMLLKAAKLSSNQNNAYMPLRTDKAGALCPECLDIDYSSSWRRPYPKKTLREVYKSPGEIEFQQIAAVTFEGPFFPRQLINDIGLPRQDFFIIGDDTEYSIRLSQAGYKIFLVPEAQLIRAFEIPENKGNLNWKQFYALRNHIVIDMSLSQFPVNLIRPWQRTIYWLWVKGCLRLSVKNIKIIMRAAFDGFRHKLGKTVEPGAF